MNELWRGMKFLFVILATAAGIIGIIVGARVMIEAGFHWSMAILCLVSFVVASWGLGKFVKMIGGVR